MTPRIQVRIAHLGIVEYRFEVADSGLCHHRVARSVGKEEAVVSLRGYVPVPGDNLEGEEWRLVGRGEVKQVSN